MCNFTLDLSQMENAKFRNKTALRGILYQTFDFFRILLFLLLCQVQIERTMPTI